MYARLQNAESQLETQYNEHLAQTRAHTEHLTQALHQYQQRAEVQAATEIGLQNAKQECNKLRQTARTAEQHAQQLQMA